MSRLTDAVEQLEFRLAENPGLDDEALLGRRIALRKALFAYGQECYEEGRHDGMRDVRDTQYEAQRQADEAERAAEDAGDG